MVIKKRLQEIQDQVKRRARANQKVLMACQARVGSPKCLVRKKRAPQRKPSLKFPILLEKTSQTPVNQ